MTSKAAPPVSSPAVRSLAAPLFAFAPAAALIGVTGAIVGQGHDGLALTLGLAGGAYLWAAGLPPSNPSGAESGGLPAYLARRYASPLVGYAATAALGLAFVLLLAAELTALSSSVSALTPYLPFGSFVPVVVLLLLATLAATRFSTSERLPSVSAVAVALILLALILALAALAGPDGPGVAVSTPTLGEIGTLERSLIERRLADPAVFKPYASPFLRLDLANTLAVVACLSFGAAILAPALVGSMVRHTVIAPTRMRTLVLAIAPLVLITALAAAARRTLLALVDTGLKAGSLPAWLSSLQTSGAAAICNAPPEAGPAALVKACGKGVGPEGLMRWQDVAFAPDSVLVATLSSLPGSPLTNAALGLVLLAAAAATVATAHGAAGSIHAAMFRPDSAAHPRARLAVVTLVWILAALLTATRPATSATLLVWAASLAAAGLAPALLASALPRPSRIAALAAIALGCATVLALTLTARYDAMDALAVSTAYEPMAPPALRKMTTLFTALGLAGDGTAKAALLAQIDTLARDNISWIGLKPIAAGAWGLLASAAVMAIGQAIAFGIGRLQRVSKSE